MIQGVVGFILASFTLAALAHTKEAHCWKANQSLSGHDHFHVSTGRCRWLPVLGG